MKKEGTVKIAHVVYSLTIGGVTNVIKQLLSRKEEGVEQILILLSSTETIPEDLSDVKIYQLNCVLPEEYTLKGFAAIWLRSGHYFNEIVRELEKIYQQEKFDIYHFHGIPKDLPIGALLEEKVKNISLVYTDHLLRIDAKEYGVIKTKALSFIYKQFYKAYHVIFVSQAIFTTAKQLGFVNLKHINKVIENSIDTSAISPKTKYSIGEQIKIVYVSRLSAVKGHFLLLPVAELLINKYGIKNFQFVLIGPGELREALQQEIDKRNLSAWFRLTGPQQNVPQLLPDFDIAVFPSEREGLPVALLEKMSAGLPVVASDIPEIKNVIQKENEALLFPGKNAEACAEQLYRVIESLHLREQLGAAAKKAVKERYSTPLLEKYIAFYKELI